MSAFTEDELSARPALRQACRTVSNCRTWVTPPNPTIVHIAEISGDVGGGHAFGRISATGDTREEALDHLQTLVERIVDRVG